MQKPKLNPIELPTVDWSEPERQAWQLKGEGEPALSLARQKLRLMLAEVEGLHGRLQVILQLLELTEDGGDGQAKA